MADVSVRSATPSDVDEIARIQLDTWRIAYPKVVPAHVLERLSAADVAEHWEEAVRRPPSPRHRVLVALEATTAVGFAAVIPASDEDADPTRAALVSTLLVEPRWGRRGHGSRLLAATADLLKSDGVETMLAWVLDGDPASKAFYAGAGWEPDGASRYLDMNGRLVTELRLHASIADLELRA